MKNLIFQEINFVTTHLIKNPLLILCVLFLAKTQWSQSFKNAKLKKSFMIFFIACLQQIYYSRDVNFLLFIIFI